MQEIAPGVWHLSGFPRNAVNTYLLGDVLVDAGSAIDGRRILRQLRDRALAAHTLTHAHLDHAGSSHRVCEALGIPLWCGAGDVEAVESGRQVWPGGKRRRGWHGHPVARGLHEGDEVAGFTVLGTPGHAPGHVSYWRETDRVLVCGDVVWGFNPLTLRGAPREPFALATPDPPLNRASARRLAGLRPALVCFGHGPPLRDPGRFAEVVASFPDP